MSKKREYVALEQDRSTSLRPPFLLFLAVILNSDLNYDPGHLSSISQIIAASKHELSKMASICFCFKTLRKNMRNDVIPTQYEVTVQFNSILK